MKLIRLTYAIHIYNTIELGTLDNLIQLTINRHKHRITCISTSGANYHIKLTDVRTIELYDDTKP